MELNGFGLIARVNLFERLRSGTLDERPSECDAFIRVMGW